jgi:hypothetical protein
MKAVTLSPLEQVSVHLCSLVCAARRRKLRGVLIYRSFTGLCRALRGV